MAFRLLEANTRFALPIIHPKTGETVSAETLYNDCCEAMGHVVRDYIGDLILDNLAYGDEYDHERDGGEAICEAVYAWSVSVYAQLPAEQLNIHSTWAGLGGAFSRIDHKASRYAGCVCKCCAPAIACEDDAKAHGYTRLVYAECDMHDGVYLIKPDADLDDVVTGWCDDTSKLVKINGWNWTFTDA